MATRRTFPRFRPLPRHETEFREWAARGLRERLISIPWYAARDAEIGMEFWRIYQGSQANLGREEYRAAMTGPDVPLLPRTWRRLRFGLRDARKVAIVELAAWGSMMLDLRYPPNRRHTLYDSRCHWQDAVADGRRPTLKTLARPPGGRRRISKPV